MRPPGKPVPEKMDSRDAVLDAAAVELLADVLQEQSGMVLPPHRPAVLHALLGPVARNFGLRDVEAIVAALRQGNGAMRRAVAEALATGSSTFFRDPDGLACLLAHLLSGGRTARRIRIWCAACAAGQEAYSIAMLLEEAGLSGHMREIVATDFSTTMSARAEAALYSADEMAGMSEPRRTAYFTRDADHWRVRKSLRQGVRFTAHNLLGSAPGATDCDAVLCCNLLIYFDASATATALDRIAESLVPGGLLLLGRGEKLRDHDGAFEGIAPNLYRRST